MESTERLIRTWMVSEEEDEVQQIVADLSSGKTSLLNVVKALGEYLPSEEDELRTKGVKFLSKVLEAVPPSCVNKQATRMLVVFYGTKLEDPATVTPALEGILPLCKLPTTTPEDVELTFKAMVTHLNMKQLTQSTRYIFFKIIDLFVAQHRPTLLRMGNAFVEGYINLVDGEKDPRNLLLAFAIDRVLCIEFDISNHIEDMFNIIFCYFPITFKPPKDDPYGISADDLQLALRSCLSASASFGRLAFPLFLEKLYAGSPSLKGDILDTITICLPVFGKAETQAFAKKLWNAIKIEIVQPVNPEIEAQALLCTKALIKTLYDEADDGEDAEPKGLVSEMITECVQLLSEPEKSQAVPASKIIALLIGTTQSVARYSLDKSVTLLISLFRNRDEVPNRPQILTLLCVIITAVESNQEALADDPKVQTQLQSYKDDVLGVFVAGLQSDDSRDAAIEGLRKLIAIQGVILEQEMAYIVHTISDVLQSSANNAESSCDDALDLLVTIAKDNSKVVEESTLPLLFSSLPDSAPGRSAVSERVKYWQVLRWLEKLCVTPVLFETLVVRLTAKLDLVCSPSSLNGEKKDDQESIAAYAYSIVSALATVLLAKEEMKHTDIPKYADRLMRNLYNLFFYLCSTPGIEHFLSDNPRLISVAAKVITVITRSLPVEQQKKFALDLEAAFLKSEPARVATGFQKLPEEVSLNIFEPSASPSKRNLVILFSAPIVGFRKGVLMDNSNTTRFLTEIQSWGISNNSHIQRQAAFQIIAASLNKNVEVLAPFVDDQFLELWMKAIEPNVGDPLLRRNAVESWGWILKALVARNHEVAMRFVTQLLLLFSDSEIAWDAARAIGGAVALDDGVMDKKNFAVIKMLHAQRYFQAVLPKLLECMHGHPNDLQHRASLVALSSLVSSLPKSVYVSEMSKLMTHLIRGLDLPDPKIRANIFTTFLSVAESTTTDEGDSQDFISGHATTLASTALKNILSSGEITSVQQRISALKLLATLPQAVRYDVLHPLKASVLRELGKALDDPKRAVRKEAIIARSAWFSYTG